MDDGNVVIQVVGVTGLLKSGKSTFTRLLTECVLAQGVMARVFPFAAPLKDIARNQFGWDGEKDERGRRLLQVLGTEAGRAYNPNIWTEKWVEKVADWARLRGPLSLAIADDLRFDNEAEALWSLKFAKASVVKIEREGHKPDQTDHVSEIGVSEGLIDHTFTFKSGDLKNMRYVADSFVRRMFHPSNDLREG